MTENGNGAPAPINIDEVIRDRKVLAYDLQAQLQSTQRALNQVNEEIARLYSAQRQAAVASKQADAGEPAEPQGATP